MSEELKRRPGRPTVTDKNFERKITRTCSITPSTEKNALKAFVSLGKAIDLAVKHRELILSAEKQKK